jgi:hypothetical protein
MGIFIHFLLTFWFTKIGSKRVIGGYTSFWWVLLSPLIGICFVMSSRRMDDEQADRKLIAIY